MSLVLLWIGASLMGQGQLQDLKAPSYRPAVVPGQREIVLGPLPQPDVTMELRFEKDIPAEFTNSTIFGETNIQYAKGFVRWSVVDGTLFDKKCRILKLAGTTKGTHKFKLHHEDYASEAATTYWVTEEGKVLRQSNKEVLPDETRSAECIFSSDHIDVSVSDNKGRRTFTVYPSINLDLIDNQFKPMLEGSKIVRVEKEYCVFEPFNQGFKKYKAIVSGTFHGSFLATKFDGIHVDINGPEGRIVSYISKEGDLVKADLPNNESLVLNNLPASRDPMVLHAHGR